MQRDEALYASVLLTLQADIAQHYFLLQELDAERAIFAKVVTLRDESCRLVLDRHEAGLASEFDVSRARTELESVRSEALAVDHRRAIAENALAILTGNCLPIFLCQSRRWRMSSFPFLPACLQVCWSGGRTSRRNAQWRPPMRESEWRKRPSFPSWISLPRAGSSLRNSGGFLIGRAEPSCSDRWWEERCRCRFRWRRQTRSVGLSSRAV